MNNQELLWMNPDKQGVLKKRGGKKKNWKKRQFLVKDTFLFYFKISKGGEQVVLPSGVVPLQGSKVDLSPQEEHETEGDEPAPTYVFIIFLPDKLLTEGVVKRNTYFLGGENLTDCYMWMKAIRHASTSRRTIKGQLNHARMEGLEEERAKKANAQRQFEMIQHLKDLQLMELSKEGKRVKAEAAFKKYHAQLGALIKKRFELRKISEQLEMFEGKIVGGPGLPSMLAVESMLLTTIDELNKLEDVIGGTEQMPPEDRLIELELAMVPIQEEYVELLALATSGEKKHDAIMLVVAAEAEAATDASEGGASDEEQELSAEEASYRSSLLTGGFS